jgi:hypothetical protein
MEDIMTEKIKYSDQTPKEEQPPVPQAADNTMAVKRSMDDGQKPDPEQADKRRPVLEQRAGNGLKNAIGKLPRDQI